MILPHSIHLTMCGNIFGCHGLGQKQEVVIGICSIKARHANKHPMMYRTFPMIKHYLTQNANSIRNTGLEEAQAGIKRPRQDPRSPDLTKAFSLSTHLPQKCFSLHLNWRLTLLSILAFTTSFSAITQWSPYALGFTKIILDFEVHSAQKWL